ncbi:MAG: hypothetical protein IID45_07720 [Planctomycetes bacterium]|nr:hypothetical protein [Planctomycetota bacterium]
MSKVERLIRGNQHRLALQTLETLEKKSPHNCWVGTNRASLLMEEGGYDEAAEILESLVEVHPDHLMAIAMFASASFALDGFELAKPAIHRAFQRCAIDFPNQVGMLAMDIAAWLYEAGHFMAARQHLTLAMRLSADDNKQDLFRRLLEFDGNRQLPYPLRGVHELAAYSGSDEDAGEASKAKLLSNMGCWRPAAKIFTRLAEKAETNVDLWQNAGLCRVWDGDEKLAAEAFRRAVRHTEDDEVAVEFETLAQLLDLNTTEDRIPFPVRKFEVKSVSSLLTRLDEDARFVRTEFPPQENSALIALFAVIDNPERLQLPDGPLTLEKVAYVVARVSVYAVPEDAGDTEDEDAAADDDEIAVTVFLTGTEGPELDGANAAFQETAAECAVEMEADADAEFASIPRDLRIFDWTWRLPEKTPVRIRKELELQKWENVVFEQWTASPLAALGGKNPRQAANDTELRIPLQAALIVVDAQCDCQEYFLDVDLLRQSLQLEPFLPLSETPESGINSCTVMQLHRLPVEKLSDKLLSSTLNRAILIHHSRFLQCVLTEVFLRPACLEKLELQRVYLTMFTLCRDRNQREEALKWLEKAKEHARSEENAFQLVLQVVIRELAFRLEDPDDPGTQPLIQYLNDYYLPKIPQLRETLTELLEQHDVTPPWDEPQELAGVEAGAGTMTEGGIWTPAAAQEKQEKKKIWLPGQD